MSTAKVTALMTTYNSRDFLLPAIESVLQQSYPNLELLIVDDASTDDSCQLISAINDKRIRLIRQYKNRGVGATLNHALQFIESEFIAKIDADDICQPERFAKQLAYLTDYPELAIVKSYFNYFTDDDQVKASERFQYFKAVKEPEHNAIDTPAQIAEELMRWNCMIHSSYFARTQVIKALGYPSYRVGEDYSLFYRAINAGYRIGCVPEYLLQMRVSNNSVTTGQEAALHFATALMEIKAERITHLVAQHHTVRVYGTGGFARAVAQRLIALGVPFGGFVDKEVKESIAIQTQHWPVTALANLSSKGLVIAAQPVRQQISQLLLQQGWREWQDFMVMA